MNPSREETLFIAAAEMATPEMRAVYLERECAGDAALRQRVEALLAKSLKADAFFGDELAATITEGPTGTSITPITEKAGDTIGRYKLLQQIGEGGCGVVYMAEQSEPVKRRVALKVIKLGMDTKQVVARFEAERQALALMDHPNIAKVLDGGATSTGRPFFVMELVRGTKITEFCDQQKLSTKERLDLFIQVCSAIQHAHQKGIIHRDIKPSNVLVTMVDGKPVPKVIDFGIAKATTGQELTDKTLFTAFEQFIGTPAYMSPEQAEMSGVDIDTRSDIYSLGVLLYELLTGRTPFDAQELLRSGLDGIRKTLREKEPPKPSTRLNTLAEGDLTTVANARHVEPPKLLHSVRGDLDWVVMKCLEKDRARRYETANGLAADLKRHLSNEPVVARPPSLGYLLQKAYRRNKLAFAAATAVAVALLIGIVASTWQAVRATRAEKAAETETHRALEAEKTAHAEAERATKAEVIATQERETARQALARSALSLAEAALREGNGSATRSALADVPESLRNSTWSYLHGESDTSFTRIDVGAEIHGVVGHPRIPSVFIVVDSAGKVTILNVRTGVRLLEFAARFPKKSTGSWSGYCVAISPDGERLAVGRRGSEGGLVVHDARDAKKILNLETQECRVLRFSPDGRWLLRGGTEDQTTELLDAKTGSVRWTVKNRNGVYAAAFTVDGRQIFVQRMHHRPELLNAANGSQIIALDQNGAYASAMSPDGRIIVSGDGRGNVRGMTIHDNQTAFLLRTEDEPIRQVAFTPGGRRFVTVAVLADGRQAVRLWNTQTGAPLKSLLGGSGLVRDTSVHPLSEELVVCGPETRVWSLGGARWSLPADLIADLAFWGADDVIFTSASESTRAIVHLHGAQPRALWTPPEGLRYNLATVSRDGRMVAVGRKLTQIPILLLRKKGNDVEEVMRFTPEQTLQRVRMNPSGTSLVTIEGSHTALELFDFSKEKQRVRLVATDIKRFADVDWLNDTELVGLVTTKAGRGTAGSEEWIVRWDATTGDILKTAANPSTMDVLAVAPDGRRLAEAGADKMVRIRDAVTLAVLKEFRAHDGPITALVWHPTKPILASGSTDLSIRLWNLETGLRIVELLGPLAAPGSLAFSPSGQRLACASLDLVTRVWDPPSLRDETAAPLEVDGDAIDEQIWFKDKLSYLPGTPAPEKPKTAVAKDVNGWENLLAALNPVEVEKTGRGWTMKDGDLLSADAKYATLQLPGNFSGTDYLLRVTLRQTEAKDVFHVVLPVADRMCGFELDGYAGKYTGLQLVNGKKGKEVTGILKGKQVKDSMPHVLEVTVRIEGPNATISATLDTRPLYGWTGPTAALSRSKYWATTEPGALALGAVASGWAVSEVKAKRLDEGK